MYFHKNGSASYVNLEITADLAGSDTVHMHIFEVAGGYDSTEQSGANLQNTNTLNGTVSTQEATTHADSFVLAMFADNFGSGVTWTPGTGFTAGQTTSGGRVVFSEGREVTSTGIQTATATQNFASAINSGIVTFYASGAGPTPPPPSDSNTFLGSVRVLDSAPAGASKPFLGTVKVVGSAPAGNANPYLGSIVLGTPSDSDGNPLLGEVVVVASVPAGDTDAFLGSVEEGS